MKNRDGGEENDHWGTPPALYDKLDMEFHFNFDPCPLHADFDGLLDSCTWGTRNFINPPYNRRDKPRFIHRAFKEWRDNGALCVLLIPAATGTKDFHELIYPYAEIRFVRGRIAFSGFNTKGIYSTTNKGKHDSMIVIFRPDTYVKCSCCSGSGITAGRNEYEIDKCPECGGLGEKIIQTRPHSLEGLM